jgi:hypothetical protein
MCKKNLCVASKTSELEGVAALKRLRTTELDIQYWLILPVDGPVRIWAYLNSKITSSK